jgi:hypothetical protein
MLANKVIKAVIIIKKSLIIVNTSVVSAEKDWLVF